MKKFTVNLVIVLMIFNVILNRTIINVNAEEKMNTGANEANEKEQAWFNNNLTEIGEIRYNSIAISRINSDKPMLRSVLPESSAVPIGEEIIPKGSSEGGIIGDEEIPKSVDNTELGCFPEIDSQGSLNSCVSYTTTYYQMSHMMALQNGWKKTDGNKYKTFSPKWTYTMVNNGYNGGTSPEANIGVLREVGAASIEEFPYIKSDDNVKNYREWSTNENVWKNAANYKVDKFGYAYCSSNTTNKTPITSDNDTDLNKIKKLLANGYVLNYLTYMYNGKSANVKNNPSSTLDDKYINEMAIIEVGNDGSHGMTIVGYNDDIWLDINNNEKIDPGELGAFKIANSWGQTYGNKGFIWLAYDSLNKVSSVEGVQSNTNREEAFRFYRTIYFNVAKIEEPALKVEFTIEHAKRSDILIELSATDTKNNKKISYEFKNALNMSGGEFAFDGTDKIKESTFTIDYDQVINDSMFNKNDYEKWSIKFTDSKRNNVPLNIKDVKLINNNYQVVAECKEVFPIKIDGEVKEVDFDYSLDGLKKPKIWVDEFGKNYDGIYTIYFDGSQYDGSKVYYELYENDKLLKSNKGTMPSNGVGDFVIAGQKEALYNYKVIVNTLDGKSVSSETITVTVKSESVEIKEWEMGKVYNVGDKVVYKNIQYECICKHTALDGWTPDMTPTLWK